VAVVVAVVAVISSLLRFCVLNVIALGQIASSWSRASRATWHGGACSHRFTSTRCST
jgi:hypothetical protein